MVNKKEIDTELSLVEIKIELAKIRLSFDKFNLLYNLLEYQNEIISTPEFIDEVKIALENDINFLENNKIYSENNKIGSSFIEILINVCNNNTELNSYKERYDNIRNI